jgi:hypothetical protein
MHNYIINTRSTRTGIGYGTLSCLLLQDTNQPTVNIIVLCGEINIYSTAELSEKTYNANGFSPLLTYDIAASILGTVNTGKTGPKISSFIILASGPHLLPN